MCLDIARVRNYDIKRLFQYDLVESSYLFDVRNLMTNPRKSTLCTELEKNLATTEYVQPSLWPECKTEFGRCNAMLKSCEDIKVV